MTREQLCVEILSAPEESETIVLIAGPKNLRMMGTCSDDGQINGVMAVHNMLVRIPDGTYAN